MVKGKCPKCKETIDETEYIISKDCCIYCAERNKMNLDNFKKYCEEHPYDKGQQEKIDKINARHMKDKKRAQEELKRIDNQMQSSMKKADRAIEKFQRKFGGKKNA